ncbi:hypothetical protein SAMN05518672_103429 [Chitinophaga sp. CF118]|uniref:hypothetical protein n=1 Tax=Chitinophaga sp. CF118 TaxID=1884367 RepID=UPI0008EB1E75|nr:hypothetical protein [Chitinophaga sp. CF118]SFD83547.1 hypothetical protein SAMN05518672_103429 [Chitinophaga sp. CF118]
MEAQNTCTQAKVKIIQSHYDYHAILKVIIAKGKEMFGPRFQVDDIDRPVIMKLIAYFLQDENVATAQKIDLYKGLIIMGPIGCGKTAIMRILKTLLRPHHQYSIQSCYNISLNFLEDGSSVIERYTSSSFDPYTTRPRICCFDDLGSEPDVNYWGNIRNVMAEILLRRYDLFMEYHMLTYMTTNLSSAKLEERYGDRLRSRTRQMCQVIAFSGESKDKRI